MYKRQQYLSRELAALGITVQRESTIGDNHSRLADFVNEAKMCIRDRLHIGLLFRGIGGKGVDGHHHRQTEAVLQVVDVADEVCLLYTSRCV